MRTTLAIAAGLLLLVIPVHDTRAVTLQAAYDAAGPGEGYDKLLDLDKNGTYTGGLVVSTGTSCCIHGNGSMLDLEGASIEVTGFTTLDIDHCILVNGFRGIYFQNSATGIVRNNTIRGNFHGVSSFYGDPNLRIENNLIVENTRYGIYARDGYEPFIQYNTVWGNPGGDYMENCG